MIDNKKYTSLYNEHIKLHAKMVDFAGFIMPVNYKKGIQYEYNAVRTQVGIFDVSHMGEIFVSGKEAASFIDEAKKTIKIKDKIIGSQEVITINGSTGEVIKGRISTVEPELSDYFNIIMQWANEVKKISIRTNAETPEDVKIA